MDKGIRPFANALFLRSLPTRVNDRAGNTAFRKSIIATCMDEFGITLASAATHYNHAFIAARETAKTDEALAALLVGLGRPEDKKGGRKPKAKPEAAAETPSDADADAAADAAAYEAGEAVLLSEGIKENTSTHTVTVNPEPKYSVCKASNKEVVCGDLTLDEANALIAKAATAKKAKLELVA
jgi:hypothetical protein